VNASDSNMFNSPDKVLYTNSGWGVGLYQPSKIKSNNESKILNTSNNNDVLYKKNNNVKTNISNLPSYMAPLKSKVNSQNANNNKNIGKGKNKVQNKIQKGINKQNLNNNELWIGESKINEDEDSEDWMIIN